MSVAEPVHVHARYAPAPVRTSFVSRLAVLCRWVGANRFSAQLRQQLVSALSLCGHVGRFRPAVECSDWATMSGRSRVGVAGMTHFVLVSRSRMQLRVCACAYALRAQA